MRSNKLVPEEFSFRQGILKMLLTS